jgi:hypothetical protein
MTESLILAESIFVGIFEITLLFSRSTEFLSFMKKGLYVF